MKKKRSVTLTIIICVTTGLICEAIDLILWFIKVPVTLNIIISVSLAFVYSFVYMFFVNDLSFDKSFFTFLLYACIWNLIGLLASILTRTTLGEFSIIACLVYAILNLFVMVIYVRNFKEKAISFVSSLDSSLRFINLISMFLIFLVLAFMLCDYFNHKVSLYSLFLLAISIPIIYSLYQTFANVFFHNINIDKEKQIALRNNILAKGVHYNNISESINNRNIDLNRIIYEHAKDGNTKAIMTVLNNNSTISEIPYSFCNNEAINEVLSGYYVECKQLGFIFNTDIKKLDEIYINSSDLYNLLTNLLHQAISMVKKCSEEKIIVISIKLENKQLVINCKNSIQPGTNHNNYISEDGFENFSAEAINQICKKYMGLYEITNDDSDHLSTNVYLRNIRVK